MPKTEETKVTCEILRDVWDAEGTRHPKGTIAEFSVAEAMDGVENGKLSRVKEK